MHLTACDNKNKAWYPASDINRQKNVFTRMPHVLDKEMFLHEYLEQNFIKEKRKPGSSSIIHLIRDSIDCITDSDSPELLSIRKTPFFKPAKKSGSAAKSQPPEPKKIEIN